MGDRRYVVVVTSGDMRPDSDEGIAFEHRWSPGGVIVQAEFTGAHLLHLAVAGCVLNDVHREAQRLGIGVDGVRVTAWGDFDTETWRTTGIDYTVDVSSAAPRGDMDELLRIVDEVAEIPKALQQDARVGRMETPDTNS
jgi:uncharacterized OsmC-like protein